MLDENNFLEFRNKFSLDSVGVLVEFKGNLHSSITIAATIRKRLLVAAYETREISLLEDKTQHTSSVAWQQRKP